LQPCHILAIAPLAQCDYKKTVAKKHVTAIEKKTVAKNTGKKVRVQKNQFKKKSSMP
jgi:hypothetical protein